MIKDINIENSLNTNTGDLHSDGGDIHIGNKYYDKKLKELIEELKLLKATLEKAKKYNDKYPEDPDIKKDFFDTLRNVEAKEKEISQYSSSVINLLSTTKQVENETSSSKIKEAIELIQIGNLDEAITLLEVKNDVENISNLLKEQERLKNLSKEVSTQLISASHKSILLAQISINKDINNDKEIIHHFQNSIKAYPNFENYEGYVQYLVGQNHPLAQAVFNECLLFFFTRLDVFNSLKFKTLMYDYALYLHSNGLYDASLKMCEDLEKDYLDTFEMEKKHIQNNYALILTLISKNHLRLEQYDKTLDFLERAKGIYAKLLNESKFESILNYQMTSNNLGIVLKELHRYDDSINVLNELLEFLKKSDLNESLTIELKGKALFNLGESHRNRFIKNMNHQQVKLAHIDFDLAFAYTVESIKIYQKLERENYIKYAHTISMLHSNLSLIYAMGNDAETSNFAMKEAFERCTKLVEYNESRFIISLINLYERSIPVLLQFRDNQGAVNFAKSVIELCEKRIQLNPEFKEKINKMKWFIRNGGRLPGMI
ncbi:MAG: hypothetical protein ACJA1O_003392 [Spirosomataceae bacterium]|jgi:hypothetical protein